MLASVVISTFNRRDALIETLHALGRQTIAPDQYEIVVVDDGSTDGTYEAAKRLVLACPLRVFRNSENQGVSAGRNLGMRHAHGKYLILVSDDLIVPETFIATHIDTHKRYPGYWVVGGFEQLPSLTETPFGRYLDALEKRYDDARKAAPVASGIWEMTVPTARNLSLPRSDYERIGPFDEQFRTTCEDQDWAHRARDLGIRFMYNAAITCVHNDQAGDLRRHCRFQMRGAHDTVLFCAKYPAIHGGALIARVNGYIASGDGFKLTARKAVKSLLARDAMTKACESAIALCEKAGLPDRLLWPMYRMLIGIYIFRGWRAGLVTLKQRAAASDAQHLGYHSNL